MIKKIFNRIILNKTRVIWWSVIGISMLMIAIVAFFLIGFLKNETPVNNQIKSTSPYFIVYSNNSANSTLMLRSNSVKADIIGVVAEITVRQVYNFNAREQVDLVYLFPTGTNTVIQDVKITIGKRIIQSAVVSKEKLQKNFAKIKQSRTASFTDARKSYVFQMMVSKIQPTDTLVIVELKYSTFLTPSSSIYEFYYPACIEPKYRKLNDSILTDAEFENEIKVKEELTNYKSKIDINLHAGVDIHDFFSTSHSIIVDQKDNQNINCKLNPANVNMGSKPFVLNYSLNQEKITTGTIFYKQDSFSYFITHIQPPKNIEENLMLPREYIFIVDVSQSMRDFAYSGTKALIKNLLSELSAGDRFNIILFNNVNTLLSNKSQVATSMNVKEALRFIEAQETTGGSEVFGALKLAVALPPSKGYSRSFVLITDCFFEDEHTVLNFISENFTEANFFAYGIGTAVNRSFVEKIANAGLGEVFIATTPYEVEQTSARLKEYIKKPILRNIKISFEGTKAYDVHPISIPDVFSERPVVITGKISNTAHGKIKISGEMGNSNFYSEIDINKNNNPEARVIKSLWERNHLKYLEDKLIDLTDQKQMNLISNLGENLGQTTEFTAFIQKDNYHYYSSWQLTPSPFGFENSTLSEIKSKQDTVNQLNIPIIKKDNSLYYIVDEMPSYKGGIGELNQFIVSNAQFPAALKNSGLSGNVYLLFVVDQKGRVSDEKIIRKLNPELDKEALRIIRLTSGNWIPGRHKGKIVKVYYTLPIKF